MTIWRKAKSMLNNQVGLSLVEVLLSVSIMSFVSLTVMGYFIQSVESSSEDSRRIVAIKLANMKVEQIRETLKDESYVFSKLSVMNPLYSGERSIRITETRLNAPVLSPDLQQLESIPFDSILLTEKNVNGVDYRYILDLYADEQKQFSDSFSRFTQGDSSNSPLDYLLKFRLTVYWGDDEMMTTPSKKMSTYLDSYIMFGR
jgi:type II secretory pathway pseudopilin PulG